MKTRIALIALVLAFASHSGTYAQLFSKKKYTGMVILTNQDTVRGKIIFKDKAPFYKSITLEDSVTKEKSFFDITNASCFVIDGFMHCNKENKEGERVFMLKLVDGKASLYRYKIAAPNGDESFYFFLEKKDGKYLNIPPAKSWDFNAHVSDFFAECPELSKKIRTKEYKSYDVITIAQEYNEWAKEPNVY